MRLTVGVLLVAAVVGCDWRGEMVARAGDRRLTVDQLARAAAGQPGLQLERDVIRRLANWWVEYQLFAQRVALGDSFLDSATVVEVLWPEARGYVLASFRAQLVAPHLPPDSATVDSVYAAGTHRLIQHILIRVSRGTPPAVRDRRRAQAEALRARLQRGEPWWVVNRSNEDEPARRRGGTVGVIARGETAPAFEQAALALLPGELSRVVETQYGFHILRRPRLAEVREEFRAGIEKIVADRIEALYLQELAARRALALQGDALERSRKALQSPLRFLESRTVIATFDDGRFTLGDLVRWLRTVPEWMHTQLEEGSDQAVADFLVTMMRYELMYLEALRTGVTLSSDQLAELRDELAGRLDQVKAALQIYPPAPGDSGDAEERVRRAADQVDQYLANLTGNWERFARVPILLAERLKRASRWAVSARGLERCLRRARELRAAVS